MWGMIDHGDIRRKPIYVRVAAKVIADIENAMRPAGTPPENAPNLDSDIKLLVSQMTNQLVADNEQPAKIFRKPGTEHAAETFFRLTGARFSYSGNWLFYHEDDDVIYCPPAESLKPEENRAMAKARELVHWTRHSSRLNRFYGPSCYGSEGHAQEQLVAEFGAAFLCTVLKITSVVSTLHATNIAGWLRAVKADRRAALRRAVRDAEIAVDYLQLIQQAHHSSRTNPTLTQPQK
jgi:antirestriction protein ArdC